MSPLSPVWLALLLPRADAADVVFDGVRLPGLLPEEEVRPEPGPAPIAIARDVTVTAIEPITADGEGAVRIVVRWRIDVQRPGAAVEWVLAGSGLLLESATVGGGAVTADERGTVFTGVLERSTVIELVGRVPGDARHGVAVDLMPAGGGVISVPADVVVTDAVALGPGRYAGAAGRITLAAAPERGAERPTLVLGEAAVGVTVGEGEIRVGARIRFRVADGELERVAFSAPGAGVDLVVTGPQIASWTRSGDRVEAVLLRPERSLVALEASWSVPAPQGETATFSVPDVRPEGVFRTEAALQIARDGTIDVLPEAPGWQPVAPSVLPEWGRGLVQGTPTAAFTGRGGTGTLTLFRFTPADGPATLVDVAQYTLATTHEGRVLMRAHYAVRNDRGAALRIVPPPGLSPIGVRVAGETATISRDGDAWIVPLAKSVETVEGLLSFPVEITFLGEVGSWEEREERRLALPKVDVEVAVTRVTVHLPPRYRNRLKSGQDGVVEAFTEGSGITYGFSVGDTRAAQADAIFQSAVSAWMGNEFDQAQGLLDELGALGADNEDMKRLQSNLQVVLGDEDGPPDDTGVAEAAASAGEDLLERRVKEQARARAVEEILEQEQAEKKAEEAYNVGDYEEAEENYRQALEIGAKLGKLSNREDESQKQQNVDLQTKLDKTRSTRASKESIGAGSTNENSYLLDGAAIDGDFEDDETLGFGEISGIAGGVEGGVVGGVVGGVMGGVAGGQIAPDSDHDAVLDPVDAWVPPEEPVVVVDELILLEEEGQGRSLTRDFLENIPAGREYQSATQGVPETAPPPQAAAPPDAPSARPSKAPAFKPKIAFDRPAKDAPAPDPARAPAPTPSTSSTNLGQPVTVSETTTLLDGPSSGKGKRRELEGEPLAAGRREVSIMSAGDALAAPVVTAASLSVVIPTVGQPVHYQHLLLPADATWSVPVRAKKTRRTP